MKIHHLTLISSLSLGLGCPIAAQAEQIINDNLVVSGDVCLGPDCVSDDPTFIDGVKVKSEYPAIYFDDSGHEQTREWAIIASEYPTGGGQFVIRDYTTSGSYRGPFIISKDAGSSSLYISSDSNIGFGTGLPQAELHVVRAAHPALRLEQDTSGGLGHQTWDITASDLGLSFTDIGAVLSITPMVIENGAPPASLYLHRNGFAGLGTSSPEGKLHVKSNGVQLNYFESGDGNPVQVRFRTDSENRRFLAVNNANEVKSQIIFKDNEILFTGQTDSGANRWLTIGPSGILSQGPSCSGAPCDRTFDTSYFTVPPIAERAAYMWENRHLPAVGPTTPGEQINLTEKTGGIIHELEVAHIYIEQLNERLEAQEQLNASLLARLEKLEQPD